MRCIPKSAENSPLAKRTPTGSLAGSVLTHAVAVLADLESRGKASGPKTANERPMRMTRAGGSVYESMGGPRSSKSNNADGRATQIMDVEMVN